MSLSVAMVANCAGKSSEEPDEGNAADTGGSSSGSSSTGGRKGSGGRAPGGRNAEAGRAAAGGPGTGGSATGGDSAEGGQAEAGEVSTGGTVTTGAPYPRTLEGLFQAQCDAAVSCCDKKGLSALPARCASEFGWVVIERNFERGVVGLDPDALEDCITAYENAATTCTETGIAKACRGLLAGTQGPGEPCAGFQECDRSDGPVICRFTGTDPVGTCTPLIHAKEGEPCEADCQNSTECSGNEGGLTTGPRVYCFEDEGLYCSYEDGAQTCRPLRAVGEECQNAIACGSEGRCYSAPSTPAERSCALGLPLGEECRTIDRAACANELWCDGPSGVDEVGVCREYEFYKEAVCPE